ncbi:rab9 effector protein with kelch motifs isoform 1-T1 [Aplochiton taeniatus]
MEFLPVLDPEDEPRQGIWYALIPRGGGPGVSVGHTCTYIPSTEAGLKGKVLITGGANPNGSFAETNVINLDSHEWDIPQWEGLDARYEHCSFVPQSCPQSLWVFAGALQSGNRNCIQNLQLTDSAPRWMNVETKGTPPCPRTYHTNSAIIGDKLYVFSGGEAGTTPVSDSKLHVFCTGSSTWSQPDTQGKAPPARHGHVIVVVGSKVYIHGGMAGDRFYSDLYSLEISSMKWEKVQAKGDVPPGVAGHSAVTLGKSIYVFGGMSSEGAVNTMYRFHCDKRRWLIMKFEGDLPPNRLDHSMCVLPWKVRVGDGDQTSAAPERIVHLAFVFGGMDTQGIIHSDCVVTMLM